MEMVSAAKMRRATEAVLKTRSYANLSWTTVLNLTNDVDYTKLHPLLARRPEIKRVAIILFAANRGLCGSFSSALINKVQASIDRHQTNEQGQPLVHEFLVAGKKGLAVGSRWGHKIAAEFAKSETAPAIGDISAIAKLVIKEFLDGNYDKVLVAYTDFDSVSLQTPRVKQLLPIDINAADDHLGVVGKNKNVGLDKEFLKAKEAKYLSAADYQFTPLNPEGSGLRAGNLTGFTYEPNPMAILDRMIPRLIEVQLLQALLESNASEQSARMTAMHQANEAADELVGELTLDYNKMRQAGITAEIAEIAAGAAALN